MDQQFIELFDTSKVQADPDYLPLWPEIKNDIFHPIDPSNVYISPIQNVNSGKDDGED
jgi:hypothetical protein